MRGADNIIPLVEMIVNQMAVVVTITANVADGDNWKLSTCNTQWIKVGKKITIGSVTYKVVDVNTDEYIIVSGASQPVGTWFQLPAPEFWHGSHRKVNAERTQKQDLRNDMVYLPIPDVTDFNNPDSEILYEANIRPVFLTGYDERYDNIEDQQTMYIDPCNKMADRFVEVCESLDTYFESPIDIYRREWPNFGDNTVWGNDKLIFNQKLSGVEVRLTLEVFYEAICVCERTQANTCAPANIYINSTLEDTATSGEDFELTVVDTDGNTPTITYNETTKTLEVPAAGSGGAINIDVNGGMFLTGQTSNVDMSVWNQNDDPIGFDDGGNTWRVDNSVVTIRDSGGNELYSVSVFAEGTENQTIGDAQVEVLNSNATYDMLIDVSAEGVATHNLPNTTVEVFLDGVSQGTGSIVTLDPAAEINIVWT